MDESMINHKLTVPFYKHEFKILSTSSSFKGTQLYPKYSVSTLCLDISSNFLTRTR